MNDVMPCILWRPHDAREPGFRWVCDYYKARIGTPHVELDQSSGLFNRAALINRAADRFPGKILLISDADCFPCDETLFRGIESVRKDPSRLCLPHNSFCGTTKEESRKILQRDPGTKVTGHDLPKHRKRLVHGGAQGGLWIIHHDLLNQVPVDEQFVGWGYEDVDYLHRVLHFRFPGTLFHIFHPKASMARRRANLQRLRRKDRLRRQNCSQSSEAIAVNADAPQPAAPLARVHVSGVSGKRVLVLAVKRNSAENPWTKSLRQQLQEAGHTVAMSENAGDLDSQDEVILWNGELPHDKHASQQCREKGLNHCFVEVGFFSQKSHYMLSRNGSVGGSLFSGEEIPGNTAEDENFLDEYFLRYSNGRVLLPGKHIIAMLQLEHDTSITNHSPFRRMQEFVNHVERKWGRKNNIVIKAHPLNRRIRLATKRRVIRRGSLWDHLINARVCVGINSTSLYESVLAGIPTVSVGGCVLHERPNQHRAIVREIIRRQIPVGPTCPDFEDRFRRSVGRNLGDSG